MATTEIQPTLDLSLEADVRVYLAKTPFASADIAPLSGGMANYVFRLRLAAPYRGKRTLVLKHAKTFVKNMPEIAFELSRQVGRDLMYCLKENALADHSCIR